MSEKSVEMCQDTTIVERKRGEEKRREERRERKREQREKGNLTLKLGYPKLTLTEALHFVRSSLHNTLTPIIVPLPTNHTLITSLLLLQIFSNSHHTIPAPKPTITPNFNSNLRKFIVFNRGLI